MSPIGAPLTSALADEVAAVARIDAVPMILDVVCRTTGLGFSAVARVTEDRWIACAVRDEIEFGLRPGGELQVETTICDEIRGSGRLVVIDHVDEDEEFCGHPTPRMYGFQSYISVPILRADGRFFGTLCAIDPRPARLKKPEVVGMFQLFADLIGSHLDAQERLAEGERIVDRHRQDAELREQFIAVMGHDLRNPLAAIAASSEALLLMPLPERAVSVAHRIKRSAARMSGLIDNVLDFARGRLGGGLPLSLSAAVDLESTLKQVIAELQAAWPDRVIHSEIELRRVVVCDGARVAQLVSNLLGNALVHGAPDGPVRVHGTSDDIAFELSVVNRGKPIPESMLDHLFKPFARATSSPDQRGLGLGLYIASEIAHAHGGTLTAASSPLETRFTFRMPMSAS